MGAASLSCAEFRAMAALLVLVTATSSSALTTSAEGLRLHGAPRRLLLAGANRKETISQTRGGDFATDTAATSRPAPLGVLLQALPGGLVGGGMMLAASCAGAAAGILLVTTLHGHWRKLRNGRGQKSEKARQVGAVKEGMEAAAKSLEARVDVLQRQMGEACDRSNSVHTPPLPSPPPSRTSVSPPRGSLGGREDTEYTQEYTTLEE